MIYGIAPRWRGRGLASRAVRLAARWAATLPGVKTIELRIDQDMIECQHVAANAGFVVAGTVRQFVPGTGETFEDMRYVLERRGACREDTEPQRLRLTRSSLAVQRNNQFRCTGPAEITLRISGVTH
jgi:hypothetical protein